MLPVALLVTTGWKTTATSQLPFAATTFPAQVSSVLLKGPVMETSGAGSAIGFWFTSLMVCRGVALPTTVLGKLRFVVVRAAAPSLPVPLIATCFGLAASVVIVIRPFLGPALLGVKEIVIGKCPPARSSSRMGGLVVA